MTLIDTNLIRTPISLDIEISPPTVGFSNPRIIIGNTGMEVDVYDLKGREQWSGRFQPDGMCSAANDRDHIIRNGFKYALAVDTFMRYWGDDSNFGNPANPSRPSRLRTLEGYTNTQMDNYRQKFFGSLGEFSGIQDIYISQEEHGDREWSLDMASLLYAHNNTIYKLKNDLISECQFFEIKFFKRIKEAYRALIGIDYNPEAIDFTLD